MSSQKRTFSVLQLFLLLTCYAMSHALITRISRIEKRPLRAKKKAIDVNLDFLLEMESEIGEGQQLPLRNNKLKVRADFIPRDTILKGLQLNNMLSEKSIEDCISRANEAMRTHTVQMTDGFYSPSDVHTIVSSFTGVVGLTVVGFGEYTQAERRRSFFFYIMFIIFMPTFI